MKKLFSLLLAAAVLFVAAGCNGIGANKSGDFSLGLGLSDEIGGADGVASYSATIAAVVLDKNGKIAECTIDSFQNDVSVKDGKVDKTSVEKFASKRELADSYGMKKYSAVGKEWYEQAGYFAEYIIGMTAEQVKAIPLSNGKATDSLILSGCTIGVSDFVKAVTAACEDKNKKAFSADGIKIGTGVISVLTDSSDNTDSEGGKISLQCDISAAVTDEEGKVLALSVDTVSPEIKFDASGTVTNSGENPISKKNAGDAYGMKKYSGIGKEWYEQAIAFEDYAVGLTADGIGGIKTSDDGKTTEEMLKAGCTVAVTDFMSVAKKATENAK